MKIFTILLCLLTLSIAMPAMAQEIKEDKTAIEETERLVDKYSSKIADQFNSLIDKSVPIAEEGFRIAIRLQIAKGIVNTLPGVLFIIFLIATTNEYRSIQKVLNSENVPEHMDSRRGPMDDRNVNVIFIGRLLLTVVSFVLALFTTYHAITLLVAPEWYAIKDIIELIKN